MALKNYKYRFSELEQQEIIVKYQTGDFSMNLLAKLHKCDSTISSLLKRHNIKKFSHGTHIRNHKLDELYFDDIDSQEKAYFLGILFADGCNHSNKSKISLALKEDDKELLIKLSKLVYGVENLYYLKSRNNTKPQYLLSMCSPYMTNKLNNLGMVPAKSLKLKFPKLNNELVRHFIRGYFDGDGSIYHDKKNKYTWSLISTKDFCDSVAECLNTHVCMRKTCHDNEITHTLYVKGNRKILKICDWIYEGSTIHLERKYQRYLQLKEFCHEVDSKKH